MPYFLSNTHPFSLPPYCFDFMHSGQSSVEGFALQHGIEVHTQASGRRLKKKKKNKYYLFSPLCLFLYTLQWRWCNYVHLCSPRSLSAPFIWGLFSVQRKYDIMLASWRGAQCFWPARYWNAVFRHIQHTLTPFSFLIPTTLLQLLTGLQHSPIVQLATSCEEKLFANQTGGSTKMFLFWGKKYTKHYLSAEVTCVHVLCVIFKSGKNNILTCESKNSEPVLTLLIECEWKKQRICCINGVNATLPSK